MTVWLDAAARDLVATEACRRRLRETGGPLFGYAEDDDVVIARAFGPGPRARHRPTRFAAHPDWISSCIEEAFAESAGKHSYLGEWHSHPLARSGPSRPDIAAVMAIAVQEEVDLPQPTILIQATKIFHRRVHVATLGAYRWSKQRGALERQEIRVGTLTHGEA